MRSVGVTGRAPTLPREKAKIFLSLAMSAVFLLSEGCCDGNGIGIGKGQFGSACDEKDSNSCDVNSALSCSAAVCDCLYPWMVYDTNRTKCLSSVNQPCDPDNLDGHGIECVTNSECKYAPNEFRQIFPSCSCKAKYAPSLKLHCSDLSEPPHSDQLPQICCPV